MKYTCPCGRETYSLIRGESWWYVALWMSLAVIWYGGALGLVVVGWWPAALVMVALSTLLALIAPAVDGHRGWCWTRELGRWLLLGPTLVLRMIAEVFSHL